MSEDPKDWEVATRLVRGGTVRSAFGETAEALYLTQSFIYDTAEGADARFAGNEPGFIYSRYGNPTVQMFEDRLALLEGAEACRATASGMAAVLLSLMGLLSAGDHVVAGKALFGSCRWILTNWGPRFGVETTFVTGADTDAWRRRRGRSRPPRRWASPPAAGWPGSPPGRPWCWAAPPRARRRDPRRPHR